VNPGRALAPSPGLGLLYQEVKNEANCESKNEFHEVCGASIALREAPQHYRQEDLPASQEGEERC
jgi:hypothetical protein